MTVLLLAALLMSSVIEEGKGKEEDWSGWFSYTVK